MQRKLFPYLKTMPYLVLNQIQEALLIKKLNPKLNKQLHAKGASFLLSIIQVVKFFVAS